jgi:hypothetical protein
MLTDELDTPHVKLSISKLPIDGEVEELPEPEEDQLA